MSRPGKPFVPLLPPTDQQPRSSFWGPGKTLNLLRDQLSISTWLSLGAFSQAILYFLTGPRIAFLPAFLVLLYRALEAYAMTTGWKRNTFMDGIIPGKISAQIPDAEGNLGPQPASSDIVVLLIGTRSNSPLGILAPGFKQSGDFFTQMTRDLETHTDDFGFLGATSWLNASARTTGSEIMNVMYFSSVEKLHAFAHSDYHRGAWDWWNREYKNLPHISIWHEVYHAPKGHWENIFVNTHVTGVASMTHKYFDVQAGQERWMSPVVDASRGLLKTSAGRMNQSLADEHDKYGKDPYEG